MYAIITFRDSGPIKSWGAVRATNVHNARTKPLVHAMPGAPPPRFLLGGADLVQDIKRLLRGASIDPDRLRKNGVIAYEAILTASAAFFDGLSERGEAAALERWVQAQIEWATARYGPHRIASMVLHLDEKTPHIHLVIVPLELNQDRRRSDASMRWALVGRTISGPGRFDEVQDHYAVAMASFGLIRGLRGSGRKHEPVPVYVARMAAKERAVDNEREGLSRERAHVVEDRAGVDANAADLAKQRAEHDQAVAAHAAHVLAEGARLAEQRRLIDEERAIVIQARKQALRAAAVAAAQKGEAESLHAAATAEMARLTAGQAAMAAEQDRLVAVARALDGRAARIRGAIGAAKIFVQKAEAVRGQPLTPAAASARDAARSLQAAVRATPAPDPIDLATMTAFAQRSGDLRPGR